MRVLITGGHGLLGIALGKCLPDHTVVYASKFCLDVTDRSSIDLAFKDFKPEVVIHAAAMTTPMADHKSRPAWSINNNIIGTGNVAIACHLNDTKLIYISTDYVYPGETGDYKETDPVLPVNHYAWSKLGGECAVRMIPNHLILRCAFTTRPFKHVSAFDDVWKSYFYVDEIAPIIWKLVDKDIYGTYNIGGPPRSIHSFAKESNPAISAISRHDVPGTPKDTSMNLEKLYKIIK